jgi:hypothetical protein
MLNHRDLDDPIQQRIDSIIKLSIPAYPCGSRREDPTDVIDASGYFSAVQSAEGRFVWPMAESDVVVAWKSHATLKHQVGNDLLFNQIIKEIARYLNDLPQIIDVPPTQVEITLHKKSPRARPCPCEYRPDRSLSSIAINP